MDMASPLATSDMLGPFRANIEAGISYLKRCFGLSRCPRRRLQSLPGLRLAGESLPHKPRLADLEHPKLKPT